MRRSQRSSLIPQGVRCALVAPTGIHDKQKLKGQVACASAWSGACELTPGTPPRDGVAGYGLGTSSSGRRPHNHIHTTASGELIRSRQTGLARHRSAERAILQLLLDSLRLVDTAVLDACMHCRAATGAA